MSFSLKKIIPIGSIPHLNSISDCKVLVIMLHGYGSNGQNMINMANNIHHMLPYTGFIAPNAPNQFENDYSNSLSYQWFSLIDRSPKKMLDGANSATKYLINFVNKIHQNLVDHKIKIIILGFSQGAMLAAHFLLSYDQKIDGIIMCSGGLIAPALLERQNQTNIKNCKILLTHGNQDQIVPIEMSRDAHSHFQKFQLNSELFIERNTDHTVGYLSLGVIKKFIESIIL